MPMLSALRRGDVLGFILDFEQQVTDARPASYVPPHADGSVGAPRLSITLNGCMVGVVGVYHHAKTGVVPVIHYGTEQSSKFGCRPAFRYTSLDVDEAQELLAFAQRDETQMEAVPRPLHPRMQSLDSTDTLQKIRCTVSELSRLQLSEVDDTLGLKASPDSAPQSDVLKLLFRKHSLQQRRPQQQHLRLPVFPAIPTPTGEVVPDLYTITMPGAAAITIPRQALILTFSSPKP